jgi:hypothetical protein
VLPALRGQYFVCEPAGNLIHRRCDRAGWSALRLRRAPGEEKSEFACQHRRLESPDEPDARARRLHLDHGLLPGNHRGLLGHSSPSPAAIRRLCRPRSRSASIASRTATRRAPPACRHERARRESTRARMCQPAFLAATDRATPPRGTRRTICSAHVARSPCGQIF